MQSYKSFEDIKIPIDKFDFVVYNEYMILLVSYIKLKLLIVLYIIFYNTYQRQETEENRMEKKHELPIMMSAKDLQTMGFSRGMAYRLLRGDLIPVITIGSRRFIRQNTLLEWLENQERTSGEKCISADISPDTIESGVLYEKDGS